MITSAAKRVPLSRTFFVHLAGYVDDNGGKIDYEYDANPETAKLAFSGKRSESWEDDLKARVNAAATPWIKDGNA